MKSLEPNGNARDLKCFGIGLLHSNGCNITRGLLHFVLSRRDKAQPQAWLGGKFSIVSTIFPLKCQCLEDFPATFDDRIYGFVCIYRAVFGTTFEIIRNPSTSVKLCKSQATRYWDSVTGFPQSFAPMHNPVLLDADTGRRVPQGRSIDTMSTAFHSARRLLQAYCS